MKNDQFADIAASGVNTARKGLEEIEPEEINARILPFQENIRPSVFMKPMDTKEELYRELECQKAYYKPFMRKLAPAMEQFRQRQNLKQFEWRIATEEDFKDFTKVLNGEGTWENITIPHFGAPLGNKTTYYRTVFRMTHEEDEAVFLHFDGVDYIANVYLNGALIGSHEGFFAEFEFDASQYLRDTENILVVEVKNDFVHKRNQDTFQGEMYGGDKIYAATGPGYDDAQMGWHHCPPGMGIYQNVYLEKRKRCFISDIYVRPLLEKEQAELWLEIYKCDPGYEDIIVEYSLYGRNFEQTVFEKLEYQPFTSCEIGLGDTFTEAQLTAEGKVDKPVKIFMEKGVNYLKIPVALKNPRVWTQRQPYLYEMQVVLKTPQGVCLDGKEQSFGMRSFHMDTETIPKGTFCLNGEKIRLRGANTMGNEQQCVIKEDYEQLLNDLLLAKICNMNFLRLTQRPVQEIVYEYCDMLGLMTQTDLPLFGVLRKNKFVEAVRQAEEMEKLVRRHPCNIVISYINEPFPNAYNQPHRHVSRKELMDFFECADKVVKMNNPDRVIKHVDGDYDPPSEMLPDNHCYTCWYNGCGVEAGALHKGYWLPVHKGWNYGCGEYGAEGLDEESVMRKYYPKEWLPKSAEEEKDWMPSQIVGSQTGNFHYFFYDTQHSVKDWIEESQKHQAWATKWMTEAFRRNRRMVSFAIHLFIDAFPAGWMKAIMDVDRNPKKAYFAYRDALTPTMISLRTDRYSCFEGEKIPVEMWVCNDLPQRIEDCSCYYEILNSQNEKVCSGRIEFAAEASDSCCVGIVEIPTAGMKETVCLRSVLENEKGAVLHCNQVIIQVYEEQAVLSDRKVALLSCEGKAKQLIDDCNVKGISLSEADKNTTIVIDCFESYKEQKESIDSIVHQGGNIVFLELKPGEYEILSQKIKIQSSSMLPMNYVSAQSGHPLVDGFREKAFWNWYDKSVDMITPILEATVSGNGIIPILISGNTDKNGNWEQAAAVAEIVCKKGSVIISQLKLAGRTRENPVARLFAEKLIEYER